MAIMSIPHPLDRWLHRIISRWKSAVHEMTEGGMMMMMIIIIIMDDAREFIPIHPSMYVCMMILAAIVRCRFRLSQ